SSLSKAIGIHILNFFSIPGAQAYHNVFHITEKKTGLLYFKDLELHTIELKKFSENSSVGLKEMLAKVHNALDMWAAFLTRHDLLNKNKLPPVLNSPTLKKALTILEVMNFDEEEREAYEGRLKWLRIEANTLKKYAAQGFEEGIEKGKKIGVEEGEKKGEKIGIEKVAINMLRQGFGIKDIQKVTGLSKPKIIAFKKSKKPLKKNLRDLLAKIPTISSEIK
ncbi:MAG TPA: Rpn family recombination-promoting nuclease/putative transposase, partial [Rhabdochlamydiaceae bacterium]|nr:Rpn family recombination-promoting nuclease/putative transposase [Rhabdochlamydiaceae bacterium]